MTTPTNQIQGPIVGNPNLTLGTHLGGGTVQVNDGSSFSVANITANSGSFNNHVNMNSNNINNLASPSSPSDASNKVYTDRNPATTKTTTYLMDPGDSAVLADATTAGFTVTLPVTPRGGTIYYVKKVDSTANVVTIAGSSGNIDGAATQTLSSQFLFFGFVFDGTNWWIVSA